LEAVDASIGPFWTLMPRTSVGSLHDVSRLLLVGDFLSTNGDPGIVGTHERESTKVLSGPVLE
jgi:hypothetical protein